MTERSNKRYQNPEKSAVPAVELARDMLCELSGPRGWNDTRESWLARGARRAGLTLRRARAIFYCEPIRLDADEYLGIERAWQAAGVAVEALQHLAREANVSLARAAGGDGIPGEGEGRRLDAPPRGGPASPTSIR